MPYSKARVVLDAVHFASETDLKALTQLIANNASTLSLELVLRILLTYLPEGIDPSLYADFLRHLESGAIQNAKEEKPQSQPSKELTKEQVVGRVRKLKLLQLAPESSAGDETETFEKFLLCRAHRVDNEIGSIPWLLQLVEPFLERYKTLKPWVASTLLPLLRFDYEYYPDHEKAYNLEAFEKLRMRSGVHSLLSRVAGHKGDSELHYGRDLRGIVGPWVYGEALRRQRGRELRTPGPNDTKHDVRTLEEIVAACWSDVYGWILDIGQESFEQAAEIYKQWGGPRDVDYAGWMDGDPLVNHLSLATSTYAQTGLAIIYQSTTIHAWSSIEEVLAKVSQISGLLKPLGSNSLSKKPFASSLNNDFLGTISTVHLLSGELLDPTNPLTRPTSDALELAFLSATSSRLLSNFGQSLGVERSLALALFGRQADQWNIFRKALHQMHAIGAKDDKGWAEARRSLLWLRSWGTTDRSGKTRQGLFSQISLVDMENEILKALITNGRYKYAIETYCHKSAAIPSEQVEKSIMEVVLTSYDNASNGNKTRGGVGKASDILAAFNPHFPSTQSFRSVSALIQATHRMSFYSLTLQHGVPFLPVNIRVHPDPLSLIDKILKQNSRSYTKLDDLLDIGRDLVKANLIKFPQPAELAHQVSENDTIAQVERSIIAKAISASLNEDDFDTAYSYIVNRLSNSQSQNSSSSADANDLLWQAAYQAGRYSPAQTNGPSALRRLEQRMELLSQALLLAPGGSLLDVLATWRDCERDMNEALARESEEEIAWQAKGDRTVPGGFTVDDIAPRLTKPREATRKAMSEEAPMGLFDVARGAAAALSKSAFPLRAQRQDIAVGDQGVNAREETSFSGGAEGENGPGRVRK